MENNQLEQVYTKYHTELYLYALSFCGNHHQAQDLVSETFYKAILSLDENKDYIKFWLFKVCKNLFFDSTRRDRPYIQIDTYQEGLLDGKTPLDQVINNEERLRIYYQVLNLPPSYKEVITLYYYCGFSLKEISTTTGISKSTAKTLLFRARRKLKTKLKEAYK